MALNKGFAVMSALFFAVWLAKPAHADQYDYVSHLDSNGIYYSDIGDVIDMGKQLCKVGRTAPLDKSMANGFGAVLMSYGYSPEGEGAIIVTGAAKNMCPDILSRIEIANANIRGGVSERPSVGYQ